MKQTEETDGAALYRNWLQGTGRKATWVAAQLGTTSPHVSLWRTGKHRPTREMAEALEKLSEGAVPAAAW